MKGWNNISTNRRKEIAKKRAVGVPPRRRARQRTRAIKLGEQMFSYVAYLAGKEGIAYSDVLTTIVASYAVNVPKNTRDQAECEFAGICARIKRAIDEEDPSAAAGAAAEAILYWEPEPTDWHLDLAEMAAALAATIAGEWRHHAKRAETP